MRRVFLDNISGDKVVITGEEHKHLSVVLRAKKGQALQLCKGDGYVYNSEIQSIDKDKTIIKIIDKQKDNCEPNIIVDLYFAIIKGEHLEVVVQKATELGVNKLFPLLTNRVVKKDINSSRLNKIALQASQQCGRGKVPTVAPVQSLNQVLPQLKEYDAVVFPYEKATASINKFLSNLHAKSIAVIIGPEGGFTDTEAQMLTKITTPISLGARILRADTASICALSIIMYSFGELGEL